MGCYPIHAQGPPPLAKKFREKRPQLYPGNKVRWSLGCKAPAHRDCVLDRCAGPQVPNPSPLCARRGLFPRLSRSVLVERPERVAPDCKSGELGARVLGGPNPKELAELPKPAARVSKTLSWCAQARAKAGGKESRGQGRRREGGGREGGGREGGLK